MGEFVPRPLRGVPPGARPLVFPKGLGLHAMITSAGVEHRRAGDAYDWHGLRRGAAEFVLLQHTLAGRGRLTLEGRTLDVAPGQTMLLHFPHDNRYWLPREPGATWSFFYLCLNGSEVMRAWRAAIARLGPLPTLTPATRDAAATACAAVLAGDVATPGRASSLAYDLAMRLLDEALPMPEDPSPRPRRDPNLQRAIDHARARLDRPVSVADLAAVAGYSRFHFTRLFTKSEGMPPGEFVLREKMKHAVRLLQSTDEPVKAVAHRCGFDDPNYFGKAFRRAFGVAPGEFRRSGMYRG